MKAITPVVLLVLAALLTGSAPAFSADYNALPDSAKYVVLKGGRYSPSEEYEINNFNGSTTSRLDTRPGSGAEIALGQYSNAELALELGIGYFESKGRPSAGPGRTRLKAVPIFITAKEFIPLAAFQPYLEFGIGAYITKLEVSGNTGSFSSQSKTAYGFHAGIGFDKDITNAIFIGIEGRYVRVKADYGGQPVKLNGFMKTINLGYRY